MTVLHTCQPSWRVIGAVEIQLTTTSPTNYVYKAFSHECAGDVEATLSSTNVTLSLPRYFGCRAQYWLERPPTPHRVRLRLWLEDSTTQRKCGAQLDSCYKYALERISYTVQLPPPPDRLPCLHFVDACASGFHLLRAWSWRPNQPRSCARVADSLILLKFPAYFHSEWFIGVVKELPRISNAQYTRELVKNDGFNKFTLSLWIYIESDCVDQMKICSILHGLRFHKNFSIPMLLLNNKRELQVHFAEEAGQIVGEIVLFPMPLRMWLQIIVVFEKKKWTLYAFDQNKKKLKETFKNLHWNDDFSIANRHCFVIGGSEAVSSFHGLVGEAVIFRGFNPPIERIVGRNTDSPMMSLQVTPKDFDADCRIPLGYVNSLLQRASARLKVILKKDRCDSDNPFLRFRRRLHYQLSRRYQCRPQDAPVPNWPVYLALREKVFARLVTENISSVHSEAGQLLLAAGQKVLDAGQLEDLREPAHKLRMAHCLGKASATFLLSLIYSYGLGKVQKNSTEALRLLLTPRPRTHRLLNLAAGHRLLLGVDGTPLYPDLGLLFHHRVAITTHLDSEAHLPDDVALENVRLTNERELKEQTDEDDDLFHWIKHQAERNVPWAKRRLARIWYWGTQGIGRDLNQAASVLHENANAADAADTDSLDYGLVLLKGQGTTQDVDAARKHLKRASNMGNPYALNALAWTEERYMKNFTRAVELYQKAHELGSFDATYNLGIIYHTGTFPGIAVDHQKAFRYFQHAAEKGGMHAGYLLAFYFLHGVPQVVSRDDDRARDWMRFVAEQNIKTGKLLSGGVRAYRKKEWRKSFINFVQAAYCGLEIGNFNLGVLCEDQKSDFSSFMKEECSYFHYNLSLTRQIQLTNGHAHLKMGDCFWFGCRGSPRSKRDAIAFYNTAALRMKVPQAFFNLGYIAEQGYKFSAQLLLAHSLQDLAKSDDPIERSKLFLALKFYEKCEEIEDSDAQLPCQIAKARLEAWLFLLRYNVFLTFLFTTAGVLALLFSFRLLRAD